MKGSKSNVVTQIRKMEEKREERRAKMNQQKIKKKQLEQLNAERGKNVDIDFQILIEKNRFGAKIITKHNINTQTKLCVCVRKRPIFKKQQSNGQIDAVSAANPQIKIHQPKFKVDGITKYIQNHMFTFDHTFNQQEVTYNQKENIDIYKCSLQPHMNLLIKDGVVTCFAYGQTGSGKTYTVRGIQQYLIQQLYQINKNFTTYVSFFQIYGSRCNDLLNNKNLLQILQDKNNAIQINGLVQKLASNAKQLFSYMEMGFQSRTTHATVANDVSSRSHAICQIVIKDNKDQQIGKLVLVDLAGSQRAQDTMSNNRQRRIEGAQINKSLLALKQCIRAMDDNAGHVPFRASKLTLVLRDSFLTRSNRSRIIMIACISPGSSSSDHSLNTLRYADRLKDRTNMKNPQLPPPPSTEQVNLLFKKEKKYESIQEEKILNNDSNSQIKQSNNNLKVLDDKKTNIAPKRQTGIISNSKTKPQIVKDNNKKDEQEQIKMQKRIDKKVESKIKNDIKNDRQRSKNQSNNNNIDQELEFIDKSSIISQQKITKQKMMSEQ